MKPVFETIYDQYMIMVRDQTDDAVSGHIREKTIIELNLAYNTYFLKRQIKCSMPHHKPL